LSMLWEQRKTRCSIFFGRLCHFLRISVMCENHFLKKKIEFCISNTDSFFSCWF
jgi:hypothetical protein